MKRRAAVILSLFLLLSVAGCSRAEGQTPPGPASKPAELSVSDLNEILAALEPSDATITYYGEETDTCDAGRAIRADHYLTELQNFTWEEYHAPAEWDGSGEYRCVLTAPGVTLTAYQSGSDNARPLHVETEYGEGMFTLPYLAEGEEETPKQVSWMVFDAFTQWYREARTAARYQGEATPLSAEELDWFTDYTAFEQTDYDESWGGYVASATEISCFFTSQYSDPRDLDAQEFLVYCPSQHDLGQKDEAEFRLVQEKLDWRSGDDGHLFTVTEMPMPCHRLPRTYINEILTRYAGITVEEMHTDWTEEAFYIPETDCFYTFTSDFGPGFFIPCYGERDGDVVTLWEGDSDKPNVLTLQKSGEDWRILSHQTAE